MILQGFDRSTKSGKVIDVDVSTQDQRDTREIKPNEIFSTTPWVLLSIIWYLSQLKRRGMAQTPSPLPVKKQKKSQHFSFRCQALYTSLFMIEY